ncbi:MAG: GrpB family protein [Natronospirillum sp.]
MTGRRIEVVPYDAAWPRIFDEEREKILDRLSIEVLGIHHIGSTAVEGLEAKPVIDILIEVADIQTLDNQDAYFESLGYECKGEYGIAGRRYYQKGGSNRTHHIHAFGFGSDNAIRHLAFKEYLKAHPSVAQDYGALKMEVAASCNDDIGVYCNGKADFVEKHEKLALTWWARSRS